MDVAALPRAGRSGAGRASSDSGIRILPWLPFGFPRLVECSRAWKRAKVQSHELADRTGLRLFGLPQRVAAEISHGMLSDGVFSRDPMFRSVPPRLNLCPAGDVRIFAHER